MSRAISILKKILIITMIFVLLNNFMMLSVVDADLIESAEDAYNDTIGEEGQGFFASFLGLLTLPIRAIVLGLATGINALTAAVAYIEGATEADVKTYTITPFDIFFNKVKILDINFFEIGNEVNIVNTIRTGIAAWYYALRLIAMAILLVLLIYVGIRMAISTIATDRAMYKRMLFDWTVSLVLIFLINYIIIFVISLNNAVIESIENSVNAVAITDTYDVIRNLGFKWVDMDSIPATVIYCMLVVQTMGLLISYFNRMLKVAFLIIISPLITLTYAVDKMGDGKAQALSNWIREFLFTVLTQLFHCIIYMSMINVTFNMMSDFTGKGVGHALATAVMAILCVNFVRTAEDLVRKILMKNHNDKSLSVAGGMAATAVALQKSKSLGVATRKSINATKENLRVAGNVLKSVPRAAGAVVKSPVTGAKAVATAVGTRKEMKKFDADNRPDGRRAGESKEAYKTRKEAYKIARREKKAEVKTEKKRKVNAAVGKVGNLPGIKQVRGVARGTKKVITAPARGAKKFIGTPLSKLSNLKHKLNRISSQSSSYKVISSIAKGYTATSMGVLTGSMMYGATGKAGQAIGIGVAGYQMHRGFQKSALTMESTTQSNLIGAGVRTKDEALAEMHESAQDRYDGESQESVEEGARLLQSIGDSLISLVGSKADAQSIKSRIDRIVKQRPEALQSTIDDIISEQSQKEGCNLQTFKDDPQKQKQITENLSNLRDACSQYATFSNRKEIHSQMVAAQQMDISMDTYVQECTEGFVERNNVEQSELGSALGSERKNKKIISQTLEEVSERRTDVDASELVNSESIDLDAISDIVESERKALENAIELANDNERRKYEQQLEDLKTAEDALADEIIRAKDKALQESQREILRRVKGDYERQIARIQGDVDDIKAKAESERTSQEKQKIRMDTKVKIINDILASDK